MKCDEHIPELRSGQHYDPAYIHGDAWVCAQCEAFLRWDKPPVSVLKQGQP